MPSRRIRRKRHDLLKSTDVCFYCENSFDPKDHPNLPAPGEPYHSKYLRWIAPTLEHLEALANNGTHRKDNIRVAHSWCNSTAADMTIGQKLELVGKKMRALIDERDYKMKMKAVCQAAEEKIRQSKGK